MAERADNLKSHIFRGTVDRDAPILLGSSSSLKYPLSRYTYFVFLSSGNLELSDHRLYVSKGNIYIDFSMIKYYDRYKGRKFIVKLYAPGAMGGGFSVNSMTSVLNDIQINVATERGT